MSSPAVNGSGSDSPAYKVVSSDDARGRYLVAARDVEAGEVVVREEPIAFGPTNKSPPVCLGCSRIRLETTDDDESKNRCRRCHYPLCPKCDEEITVHQKLECRILSAAWEKSTDDQRHKILSTTTGTAACPYYACITPLRLLLHWEKDLAPSDLLMDHNEERMKDKMSWLLSHMVVVGNLRGAMGLGERFSAQQIQRAIGIIRTNGVKLDPRPGLGSGIAVFPTYSLINHNCVCNTRTRKLGLSRGHAMEVVAVRPIAAGEEITTRYTTPQWGTFRRQQMTQNYWHFVCRCTRCLDPTEMGSMLNAVGCSLCEKGYLLPADPTCLKSEWVCDKCGETMAAADVNNTLLKFELEVEKSRDVDVLRDLLQSYSTRRKLHPNHFLLVALREKLIPALKMAQSADASASDVRARLEEQVKLFGEIKNVMVKVDQPPDVWEDAMGQLERELEKAKQLEKDGVVEQEQK